jgi:hypothetical protein
VKTAEQIHAENRERIERERADMAARWGINARPRQPAPKEAGLGPDESKPKRTIGCLSCGEPFHSTGPGHRLCHRCRKAGAFIGV